LERWNELKYVRKFKKNFKVSIFISLFRNCQNIDENILIVKDFEGYVFGGFCSNTWEMNHGFYGTGESFLFTFKVFNFYFIFLKKNYLVFFFSY